MEVAIQVIDAELSKAIRESIQTRGVNATIATVVIELEDMSKDLLKIVSVFKNGSSGERQEPTKKHTQVAERPEVQSVLYGISKATSSSLVGYYARKAKSMRLTATEKNAIASAAESRKLAIRIGIRRRK